MQEVAAALALVVLLGLASFQVQLVLGAPWGRFAWGGRHDVLPPPLRAGSAFAVVVYCFCGVVIAEEAGLLRVVEASWTRTALGWVTAYFALGIIVNAASRSLPERLVMTPVAATLALLCLVVAIGA